MDKLNVKNLINIKVIGIGGAGNNAVNRMIEDGIEGVEFYEFNTEVKVLEKSKTKNVMQIGKEITKGLGAGGDVSIGERAAMESKDHLIGTAAQAVTAFKEKGREKMNKVLQKGISGVQSVLSGCREKMVDVLTSYEKTANQIDSIGDEFK